MRKQILLLFVVCSTLLHAQNLIQVHLMTNKEIMESAQVLGKMVFEGNKLKIYDMQGQLIAEPVWTEESTIEVNSDVSSVTISNGEGEQQTIEIPMGVDNIEMPSSISIDGNMLTISGVIDGENIRLYNMNGVLLKQDVVHGESAYIPVSDIPSGSYILIISNNFLKILKR